MADKEIDRLITTLEGDLGPLKEALGQADAELERAAEEMGKGGKKVGQSVKGGVSAGVKGAGSRINPEVMGYVKKTQRSAEKGGRGIGQRIKDGLSRATRGLGKGINSTISKNLGRSVDVSGLTSPFRKMADAIERVRLGAVAMFAVVAAGLKSFANLSDQTRNLAARLKLVTDTQGEFVRVQRDAFETAQRNGQSINATIELYTKLTRTGKTLGRTQEAITKTANAVTNAVRLSGSSAASAGAALFQFNQGMGSGVLRGEELNSVLEQTPELAYAIADGLGVTIAELRKMGAEGELTSERVFEALDKSASDLEARASELPRTFGQVFTMAGNVVKAFVADFNKQTGAASSGVAILEKGVKALPVVLGLLGEAAVMTGATVRGVFNGLQSAAEVVLFPFRRTVKMVANIVATISGLMGDVAASAERAVSKLPDGLPGVKALRGAVSGLNGAFKGVEETARGVAASMDSQLSNAADSLRQNNGDLADSFRSFSEASGRAIARVTGEYKKVIDAEIEAQIAADAAKDAAIQAANERKAALAKTKANIEAVTAAQQKLNDVTRSLKMDRLRDQLSGLEAIISADGSEVEDMISSLDSETEHRVRMRLAGKVPKEIEEAGKDEEKTIRIDSEGEVPEVPSDQDTTVHVRQDGELPEPKQDQTTTVHVVQDGELPKAEQSQRTTIQVRQDGEIPEALSDQETKVHIDTLGDLPEVPESEDMHVRIVVDGVIPEVPESQETSVRVTSEGNIPIAPESQETTVGVRQKGEIPRVESEQSTTIDISHVGDMPKAEEQQTTTVRVDSTGELPKAEEHQTATVRIEQDGEMPKAPPIQDSIVRLNQEGELPRVENDQYSTVHVTTAGELPKAEEDQHTRVHIVKSGDLPKAEESQTTIVRVESTGEIPDVPEAQDMTVRVSQSGEIPQAPEDQDTTVHVDTAGEIPIVPKEQETLIRVRREEESQGEAREIEPKSTMPSPPVLAESEIKPPEEIPDVEAPEEEGTFSFMPQIDLTGAKEKLAALEEILNVKKEIEVEAFIKTREEIGELEAETAEQQAEKRAALEELEAQHQNRLNKIDQDGAKAREAIAKAELDAKFAMTKSILNSLSALTESKSRSMFEVGKAAAYANTFVSTYRGAQAAFTGMVETIPGPPGVAAGVAAAGSAIAAGLGRAAKIKNTKFGGGGQGGGGGGGAAVGLSSNTVSGGTLPGSQPQMQRNVNISLSGESFTPDMIRSLIGKINDEVGDGATLRVG